jgi:DNA-binding transcriptional ArsR family regulator
MVKSNTSLDKIFFSLSDSTRRDIVRRLSITPMSVNKIAEVYDLSLPAVSKHLKRLGEAGLITRKRQGKGYLIQVSPIALRAGRDFFNDYASTWNARLDALSVTVDQTNESKKEE